MIAISFFIVYGAAWYMGKARAHYKLLNEALLQPFFVDTIHGQLLIDDPLIIELITSPAMQRLKYIRQYGSNDYVIQHSCPYNRFEHSLGVFYILRVHGVTRNEQIAGLLHDISHTVFSHATDPLFMGSSSHEAYQDSIHEEFLKQYGIEDILTKYGLEVEDVLHKNEQFRALEQPLPALCADRLEYNLFAGLMDGLLTKEELKDLHKQLNFDGQNWYFTTIEAAKKFSTIPLYESVTYWQSPESMLINNWTSEILKKAWDIGFINADDIHFTITDDIMWERLLRCDDIFIQNCIAKILNCKNCFYQSTPQDYDIVLKGKFRGIDPLVLTANGDYNALSTLDSEFKSNYEKVKAVMEQGWYIKFCVPTSSTNLADQRKIFLVNKDDNCLGSTI